MKKSLVIFSIVFMLLSMVSFSMAATDNKSTETTFDTGTIGSSSSTNRVADDNDWGLYYGTGTRYVFRVDSNNDGKMEEVKTDYYINHIYNEKPIDNTSNDYKPSSEMAYFGVGVGDNKGKVTKITLEHNKGKSLFETYAHTDTSKPQHIIIWNTSVSFTPVGSTKKIKTNNSNFGLSNDDINYLANLIKQHATNKKDNTTATNMQNVIERKIEFDIRAEILFFIKLPGTNGMVTKYELSNGLYSFNAKMSKDKERNSWYYTYRECRAIALENVSGLSGTIRGDLLDRVATNLFESDQNYVFENNEYQCSCLKNMGTWSVIGVPAWNDKIWLKTSVKGDTNDNKRLTQLRKYAPAYCGIPVKATDGTTIYLYTSGNSQSLGGKELKYPVHYNTKTNKLSIGNENRSKSPKTVTSITIDNAILWKNNIEGQLHDKLKIATNATEPIIYEGWDYIWRSADHPAVTVHYKDEDTNEEISDSTTVEHGTISKIDISGFEYTGVEQLQPTIIQKKKETYIKATDNKKAYDIIFWYRKITKVTVQHVLLEEKEQNLNEGKLIKVTGLTNPETKYFESKTSLSVKERSKNISKIANKSYVFADKSSLDGTATKNLAKIEVKRDGNNHEVVFGYVQPVQVTVRVHGVGLMNGKVKTNEQLGNDTKTTITKNLTIDKNDYEKYKDKLKSYTDFVGSFLKKGKLIYEAQNPSSKKETVEITLDDAKANKNRKFAVYFFYEIPTCSLTVNHYDITGGMENKKLLKTDVKENEIQLYKEQKVYALTSLENMVNIDVDNNDDFDMDYSQFVSGGENNSVSFTPTEQGYNYIINFYYESQKIIPELGEVGIEVVNEYNQYIPSTNDKIWVLDHMGEIRVTLAHTVDVGTTTVKIKMPFDVYYSNKLTREVNVTVTPNGKTDANGLAIYAGSVQVQIPIWVQEGLYDKSNPIKAEIVYQNEGETVDTKSVEGYVRIVGQIYDFSVTQLHTGDSIWKNSLFTNSVSKPANGEYEANTLPIGQGNGQQNLKYNNGIMKGTKFYFSVNTKGQDNNKINIKTSFYYAGKDGGNLVPVDLYQNGNKLDTSITRLTSVVDPNRVSTEYQREKSVGASLYGEAYKNQRPSIGTYDRITIDNSLRTPFVNYVASGTLPVFYGNVGADVATRWTVLSTKSGVSQTDLYKRVSHWYGDYTIPNNVTYKTTSGGELPVGENIIVYFSIESAKADGARYLGYNLPSPDTNDGKTQWQAEGLLGKVVLPHTTVGATVGPEVTGGVRGSGAAGAVPVAIYGNLSTSQNYDTTGTH